MFTSYLEETIEISGDGPILMSLHNFPEAQYSGGYIKITDGDGTSLLDWTGWNRRGYYANWFQLNGRTYSSQTNRVTVEFNPPLIRERYFLNSSLQWTLAGYDTDPSQFCDCC